MAARRVFVGLDVGTSVVKAVALDQDGAAVAVATRPTRTIVPVPGHQEHDLEEVIAAAAAAIHEVAAAAGHKPALVGITGQGDGVWLVDEAGHAVRPPILWSDARAAPVVEGWLADGVVETIFRRTGNALFPGAAAPILAHLQIHEPEALARSTTAAYCKDVLLQRLTGDRATDASDASLPFLDIRSRTYDQAILDRCGLANVAGLLAPVDPWPAPARPLSAPGVALTGLVAGTPVSAGPFDFVATMIGAGMSRPGQGLVILGTTLGCTVLVDDVRTDGEAAGMTICMPQPGTWARVMAAMVGTPVLEWALATVGADRADLERLLAESTPGAGGVTLLPFLSPAGERAPFLDPFARGQLAGLRLDSTRADLVRAVCEGTAYAARHCLERAGLGPGSEVYLCGGGSRSAGWRQILADVLGRRVLLARQPEVGARGAVMSALDAAGEPPARDVWSAPEATFDPDPATRSLYEAGFAHYVDRIAAARTGWSGPVG